MSNIIDIDYSFIRLRDNITDALNLGESKVVKHAYNKQVQLCTNEKYLQITNVPDGISFQADYSVYVVDKCNNVLLDITENVFIYEFFDYEGRAQIAFEIVDIGEDFGKIEVLLRFESNTNSEYVFWSSPVMITDIDADQSTYFQYRHNNLFEGISYNVVDFYQGIRLSNLYFSQKKNKTEKDQYSEVTTGLTKSKRTLFKRFDKYVADKLNGWCQDRLEVLLSHNIIYIDGVRSHCPDPLEYEDRIELSSIMKTTFLASKNKKDTKQVEYQIGSAPD